MRETQDITTDNTIFHVWEPTMNLRWLIKIINLSDTICKEEKVLQQCFTDTKTGQIEWRDIEVMSF